MDKGPPQQQPNSHKSLSVPPNTSSTPASVNTPNKNPNPQYSHHQHQAPPQPVISKDVSVQSGQSYLNSGYSPTTTAQGIQQAQQIDILCPAVRRMGYSAKPGDTIGEGAFSQVFRGKSIRIPNKDVAVKIVRVDDPNISQAWKEHSMKRELKILKRVRHPNVITVYDVVKTRTRIYIFMDIAVASVASHLEATEEPASEPTARRWFSGISNAVAYLHQIEIAHRDLKNDNILLDSNGVAKLTDFGFACFTYDKQSHSEILSKTSCGTKAYVAPEVFNPPYNPKVADVWSLGVCLFQCVTLQFPFKDDLPTQIFIRRQIERSYTIPKQYKNILSDWLQDLLRKMMDPDINRRIRSEAVLIHPWIRTQRL